MALSKTAKLAKEIYLDTWNYQDDAEKAIAEGDPKDALQRLRAAEYYRGQYDYLTSGKTNTKEERVALSERSRYIAREIEKSITGR